MSTLSIFLERKTFTFFWLLFCPTILNFLNLHAYMHYYEWNDLIGNLLFSPAKAGLPVLLYLTKEQITQRALATSQFETEEEAWRNFARSSSRWFGKDKNLTESITEALVSGQRINLSSKSYQTDYPVYLNLLIMSVLPLTNETTDFISQADYYRRAAEYAHCHSLPAIVKQTTQQNWNAAWEHLQTWSIEKKGSAWGRFQINDEFGHVYVGKPFSQCLIPTGILQDLPRAFVRAGWVPQQPLTDADWRHFISSNHCNDLGLRQAALQTLRSKEGLKYAIPILSERFNQWDGTGQTAALPIVAPTIARPTSRQAGKVTKEITTARFFLSFPDPVKTDRRFCWQYRVYSEAGLPDTLHLGGYAFNAQFSGWSSAVDLPFQEQFDHDDPDNKWHVKWPDADIRLFAQGQWRGLSSRVWVETNELSPTNRMYAIGKPSALSRLREWGTTFVSGQFSEWQPNEDFDATGWPADYGLFQFERPTQGIPGTAFLLSDTKKLDWVGGLKTDYNTFYNRHRPWLRVINGDGSETVTALTETGRQLTLRQLPDNPTYYELTGQWPDNEPITCRLAGHSTPITCRFESADSVVQANGISDLPARDMFGGMPEADQDFAYTGLTVTGIPNGRADFLKHAFHPGDNPVEAYFQAEAARWSVGDELLTYLTCRHESRPPNFFDAFEHLLSDACEREQLAQPQNVSKLRRWALGWYDTLGYIDYAYESDRITVLPPTLIPVPCRRGHRAMLVGGRSPELVGRLRQLAQLPGVQVSIEAQSDLAYLAPSVVSLYSPQPFNGKAHSPIEQIARQLTIPYLAHERPAWRLLERSGSLIDYQHTLVAEPEAETTTWTLRVFNPDRLCFERPAYNDIDKSFTLVERQLNAWQFVHYLWMDGTSYRVDKNWGRFLVLHRLGRQVIFKREGHNQIAIPATLPLPRVLARGFALLSGKIPVREDHTFDGTRRPYLLYENAGNILSDNYIKKLGQHSQSINH